MSYTKEQLAEMSGENDYKKPKSLQLNQITFNGQTGDFMYTNILGGKDPNGKYLKTGMGKEVQVVFLKIRRILSKYRKSPLVSLQTNEHSLSTDTVMLYGADEKGIAGDLREKYPELRTHQIVYAYVPLLNQMVRLSVKGSSLGSNAKSKDVKGFYEYLSSFSKEEHLFDFITVLKPVSETGDLGQYFAMSFSKGEEIVDKELQSKVEENLVKSFESINTIDNYYKIADVKKINTDINEERGIAGLEATNMEYPNEEINPEDIPF